MILTVALIVLLLVPVSATVASDSAVSASPLCAQPSPRTHEASVASLTPIEPLKGRFLVATRQIRDPRFMETVILLLKYDREGALGLIINRPTEMKLSAVLPDVEGLAQRADLLHLGGPVGIQQVFVLVKARNQPDETTHVFDDVYVSVSSETLQALARKRSERFKVYAGYAGWAPGQLDQEIARGGWHIAKAQASAIFDRPPAEVWQEFINWSETIEVRSNGTRPSAVASALRDDSLPSEHDCLHFAYVTY